MMTDETMGGLVRVPIVFLFLWDGRPLKIAFQKYFINCLSIAGIW